MIVSAESGHVPTREIVVVVRDLGTTIGVGTDRFLTTENATADNAEAREQVIELRSRTDQKDVADTIGEREREREKHVLGDPVRHFLSPATKSNRKLNSLEKART